MKGFKHTGNGPRYVQNFAVGGLAKDNILEAPGFSDFKKGGKALKKAKGGMARGRLGAQFTGKEEARMNESREMKKVLGPQFTGKEEARMNESREMKKVLGPQFTGKEEAIVTTKKEAARLKALSKAGKLLRKARGGKVPGVSDPMSPAEAMTHSKGGLSFARKPRIGK